VKRCAAKGKRKAVILFLGRWVLLNRIVEELPVLRE
jgi:hypothetical protein